MKNPGPSRLAFERISEPKKALQIHIRLSVMYKNALQCCLSYKIMVAFQLLDVKYPAPFCSSAKAALTVFPA
jgi:hypothetical protein